MWRYLVSNDLENFSGGTTEPVNWTGFCRDVVNWPLKSLTESIYESAYLRAG